MTVCVVSKCSREKCIVAVTDKMLSMSAMSGDDLAVKFSALGSKWIAMFAGDDISPVVPIFKEVRAVLAPASCEETVEDVVVAFRAAIRKEKTTKSEAKVLSRFDIDMLEFRREGLANLGPELFTRLAYEIAEISLDITFLVFGFEGTTEPVAHIFTINGTGDVSYFDLSGFWAIGSGQTSALGTMFGIRNGIVYQTLPDVLYLCAKAKFSAESAIGVGKETTAIVLQSNGDRYLIHAPEMAKLKAVWESTRGPDVPAAADPVAMELLAEGKAKYAKREAEG
jgi:hypothetical protein